MSDQAIIPIAQADVLIAGYPVIAVLLPDGQSGAVLPMLCAILDLKPSTQAHLIHNNPALSDALVLIALETPGGTQTTNVLLEWAIALWAAGLHQGRRPPAYRELLLTIQREAGRTVARQFAKHTRSSPLADQSPSSPPPTSQSVWESGYRFIDQLKAEYEGLRREVHEEQQETRDQLAVLQYDQQNQALRLAALEAGNASPAEGLSAQRLKYIYEHAHQISQRHSHSIDELLTGLADHFRVKNIYYLSEKDWPGVLQWFESLLEDW